MSKNFLLIAAGGGVVVALLLAVLLGAVLERHHTPQTVANVESIPPDVRPSAPLPVPPAPLSSAGGADSDLAMNATDPNFVQFISSFKASADATCKASLIKATNNAGDDFAGKATTMCGCASDAVVATITVGEARSVMQSAVMGDIATNATMSGLKARFIDAGKACMLKAKTR